MAVLNRHPGAGTVIPGAGTVIPGAGTVIPGAGTVIPGTLTVIPAQAGTQKGQLPANLQQGKDAWIPACAGMTVVPGCASGRAALE